jgi:hypothetical protein
VACAPPERWERRPGVTGRPVVARIRSFARLLAADQATTGFGPAGTAARESAGAGRSACRAACGFSLFR